MRHHVRNNHEGERKCEICGMTITNTNLKRHTNICNPESRSKNELKTQKKPKKIRNKKCTSPVLYCKYHADFETQSFEDFSNHLLQKHSRELCFEEPESQLLESVITRDDLKKLCDWSMIRNDCNCQNIIESDLYLSKSMGYFASSHELKVKISEKFEKFGGESIIRFIELENILESNATTEEFNDCVDTGFPSHIISLMHEKDKKIMIVYLKSSHDEGCQYKFVIIGVLYEKFLLNDQIDQFYNLVDYFQEPKTPSAPPRICADNVIEISSSEAKNHDETKVFKSSKSKYYVKKCDCYNVSGTFNLSCTASRDGACCNNNRFRRKDYDAITSKIFGYSKKTFDNDVNKEIDWSNGVIGNLSLKITNFIKQFFPVAYVIQSANISNSCAVFKNDISGKACFSGLSLNKGSIKHYHRDTLDVNGSITSILNFRRNFTDNLSKDFNSIQEWIKIGKPQLFSFKGVKPTSSLGNLSNMNTSVFSGNGSLWLSNSKLIHSTTVYQNVESAKYSLVFYTSKYLLNSHHGSIRPLYRVQDEESPIVS